MAVDSAEDWLSSDHSAVPCTGVKKPSFPRYTAGPNLSPSKSRGDVSGLGSKQSSVEPKIFYGGSSHFHKESENPQLSTETNRPLTKTAAAIEGHSLSPHLPSMTALLVAAESVNLIPAAKTPTRSRNDTNAAFLTGPNSLPLGASATERKRSSHGQFAHGSGKNPSSLQRISTSANRARKRKRLDDFQPARGHIVDDDWRPLNDNEDPLFQQSSSPSPTKRTPHSTSNRRDEGSKQYPESSILPTIIRVLDFKLPTIFKPTKERSKIDVNATTVCLRNYATRQIVQFRLLLRHQIIPSRA